jgi:hypothetical protein
MCAEGLRRCASAAMAIVPGREQGPLDVGRWKVAAEWRGSELTRRNHEALLAGGTCAKMRRDPASRVPNRG